MMLSTRLFTILLFIGTALSSLCAANTAEPPRYRVSMITCHAGEAAYELYGHSALRIIDTQSGLDWAYNYGIFDFDTPGFTWRFILGETDYMLAGSPFSHFLRLYASQGRRVDEQVLNLTAEEAANLAQAIQHNALPENRVYRYNFFEDNCVTRALDMIEANIAGKVVMPQPLMGQTFRSMVNEHTAISPWNRFGQNLLLGQDADTIIGLREQCFSPLYTERFLAEAYIVDSLGKQRPLVKQALTIVEGTPKAASWQPSPAWCLFAVFLACWFVTRKGQTRLFHLVDTLLLAILGLGGILLFTLSAFSSHPAVGHNWTILLFHPLALLFIPLQWWLRKKGYRNYTAHFQLLCVLTYCIAMIIFQVQDPLTEMWLIAATIMMVNLSKLSFTKTND